MAPFNGSGTFNLIYNWEQDALNGIPIRADRMDAQEQDLAANGFDNTITRDGQGSASANQPMNGFVHTGVGNASLRNQYAAAGQIVDGAFVFSVAGGTADALTAGFTPPLASLVNGMEVRVRALSANATTTPTFTPDALATKTITKLGGVALLAGDIRGAGHELLLRYNSTSTDWELLNPALQQPFASGVWTPIDQSGAGLTFTNVSGCTYTRYGNMVQVRGSWKYPSTVNAAVAVIGTLPFANANTVTAFGFAQDSTAIDTCSIGASATSFTIISAANANRTNTGLSLSTVTITLAYQV